MRIRQDHPIIFVAKVLAHDLRLSKRARDRFVRLVEERAVEEQLIAKEPPPTAVQAAERALGEINRVEEQFHRHIARGASPVSFFVPERAQRWLQPGKMLVFFNETLEQALAPWGWAQADAREARRRASQTMRHDPVTDTFY